MPHYARKRIPDLSGEHPVPRTASPERAPHFRKIFNAATHGILLIDAGSREIIDVNQAFVELSGYSYDHLIRKTIWEIEPLRILEEEFNIFRILQEQDHLSYEDLPFRSGGKGIHVELVCNVHRVNGSKIIQYDIRDVTGQQGILEALRRSEEQFRLLFQSNPHPMWIFDASSLFFLAVNDAAVQVYGYSPDDFLKMTISDIHLREDVSDFLKTIRQVRKSYLKPDVWKHRKKTGEIIEVEMTSHDILFNNRNALFVIMTDVTLRKHAYRCSPRDSP